MTLKDGLGMVYDVIFREFSHRAETGLFPVGKPDKDSPVVVTGNYTETVRRMRKALKGMDLWLLIANSKGINVWCASGGGHFTHHDIISAIVTSGAQEKVENHLLILPQLGATGIEKQKVAEATGWKTIWGPASLEDLPAFLRQRHMATPDQRMVRFPLRDRMEMASMMGIPMIVIGFIIFYLLGGWHVGFAVAGGATFISYGIFAALPAFKISGRKKWISFAVFAAAGIMVGWLILYLLGSMTVKGLILSAIGGVVEMLALTMDLAGTTPWYGSYINTFRNHAHIDLVSDKCDASADCLLVCPRNVFRMNGEKRKIDIISGEDCIECGACIVQCPRDALRFRYDNGKVVEAQTIRTTRMNMLGKRTISISSEGKE